MSDEGTYLQEFKVKNTTEQEVEREKLRSATRYPWLRKGCETLAMLQVMGAVIFLAAAILSGPGYFLFALACLAGVVPWMLGLAILDMADAVQNMAKKG